MALAREVPAIIDPLAVLLLVALPLAGFAVTALVGPPRTSRVQDDALGMTLGLATLVVSHLLTTR